MVFLLLGSFDVIHSTDSISLDADDARARGLDLIENVSKLLETFALGSNLRRDEFMKDIAK